MKKTLFNINDITKVNINTPGNDIIITITGDNIHQYIMLHNTDGKYIDLIETHVLNTLNDKIFFSIEKLELSLIDRLNQAKKKDDEYQNKD